MFVKLIIIYKIRSSKIQREFPVPFLNETHPFYRAYRSQFVFNKSAKPNPICISVTLNLNHCANARKFYYSINQFQRNILLGNSFKINIQFNYLLIVIITICIPAVPSVKYFHSSAPISLKKKKRKKESCRTVCIDFKLVSGCWIWNGTGCKTSFHMMAYACGLAIWACSV